MKHKAAAEKLKTMSPKMPKKKAESKDVKNDKKNMKMMGNAVMKKEKGDKY